MDKYQKILLENEKGKAFYYCTSKKYSGVLAPNFDYESDCYSLIQDEDIFATKYPFVLKQNSNIETCSYYLDGTWRTAEQKGGCFVIMLDFENRIEKVKLTFADNIVDDYSFFVRYVEADKELYYQKQAEAKRNKYAEAAQIKHSTGAELVNIYFQPCCSECEKTEIELWIAKGIFDSHGNKCLSPGYSLALKSGTAEQLIARFCVEDGVFFKSINGLANGVYGYRLKQYDKKSELLFESDFYYFVIRSKSEGRPIGHANII